MGQKIERYAGQKQRDRKMNQHHVLGMLCENYRFQVKGMQGRFPHCTMTLPVIFG